MRQFDEKWIARAIVACVVVIGAFALAPELTIGRVDLNDEVFHFTIADAIVNRLAHGRSALDFWMPEWSFGYPVLRAYQPLAAWLLAVVQIATGQHFPLGVTFAFLRWLLLATFPLSLFMACRLIGFRPLTSAAASIIAPLIVAPNLYGLDYGSYLWRGNGLYTQLVAMHFFVLAIGFGCRAIRRGGSVNLAALFVALTFLAHLIYGYMAALTLVAVIFFPGERLTLRTRLMRLTWIGALTFALTAFQLVPMLRDGAFINRSRWEPAWKWDSFGLKQALVLVATGEIVDAQRLPIVAVLALIGAIYAVRRRDDDGEDKFALRFTLAAALFWLFMFAGPATWGPLERVLGAGDQVQTHRFVGALHAFLIILAGVGLARLWSLPQRHGWRFAASASIAITAIALAFPIAERAGFLANNTKWGSDNLAAYESQRADIDRVIAAVKARGGRTYPGLAGTWGNQFKVGYVPFHAFLSRAHVPAIAFLYHAMALPADIMVRFDETRPEQYRLFDIRNVVADAGHAVPHFLAPVASYGNFRVFSAPSPSAFDLVDARYSVYADRRSFYDVNDAWLQSNWPAARQHLLIDYETVSTTVPRLPSLNSLASLAMRRDPGRVLIEQTFDNGYAATVTATSDEFVLLKSTYHPNWRAEVDRHAVPVAMLTPGFAAVRVGPGLHTVRFRYDSGLLKPFLLVFAIATLIAALIAERRGFVERWNERLNAIRIPSIDVLQPAILILLILPVIAPLAGGAQTAGHDAREYMPRLVEFHENIRHGILLPRWAPDLSSGQGQPLFLLNPPLFYYIADAFHIIGLSFARAINTAVIAIIVASALAMYQLARYWFGTRGALLAAVAYVYAPYFLVDGYVRAALAELSAFPFYPIALYGFARHADGRKMRDLAIGALGYAGVWFAHTPSAVLFSPLLGAYLIFLAWQKRSASLLATHTAAVVLALALAAPVWIPAVTEAPDTNSHRLTEGDLRYSNHFVYPRQLFGVGWGYGVSVRGDQDGMPFNLGWTHLLLGAMTAVVLYRFGDAARRQWLIFFGAATFAICYLVTPRSHAIWDAIPQLHYVAFPWRLLADSAFCLALIAGAFVWALDHVPPAWRTGVYVSAIALVILGNVPHAQPASYLAIDPLQWTPHEIAARNVIAATFDTFEPRWVETRPVYNGERIEVNRGAAIPTIVERTPERLSATVQATSDAELELPIAYFPGWRVTVDGGEAPIDTPSAMGRIRVSVSPGSHRIEARFGLTPMRAAADIAAVVAVIVFALLFFFDARRSLVVGRPALARTA